MNNINVCLFIGIGVNCFCFNNLVIFWLCESCLCVVLFKFDVNCVNVVNLWYCVNVVWILFDNFLIVFVCVVEFIWEIEILGFIVGWIFELNRFDFKKIWLLVIEIMLVGMNVEMLFVWVLIIGNVVKEFVWFFIVLFVKCLI